MTGMTSFSLIHQLEGNRAAYCNFHFLVVMKLYIVELQLYLFSIIPAHYHTSNFVHAGLPNSALHLSAFRTSNLDPANRVPYMTTMLS